MQSAAERWNAGHSLPRTGELHVLVAFSRPLFFEIAITGTFLLD
jgi:hypothetical protein